VLAAAAAAGLAACTSPPSPASHAGAAAGTPVRRPPPPSPGTPSRPAGAFRLLPARGPGHLAPGSDPRALPGGVLIADEDNRENQTISVIDIATGRITRRYGHPGVPGSGPGYYYHPDDAMLLPGGQVLVADILNCRILLLSARRITRQLGSTSTACTHEPPRQFAQPNGAFPLHDGHYLITEILGDWVDEMSLDGHVYWSAHPPGVRYPSDANEVSPGRYLVADYSDPGQVVIFTRTGRLVWRSGPPALPRSTIPRSRCRFPTATSWLTMTTTTA